MKALVLAGGSGTRLRPITHTSAKQLVPVGNKPVLFFVIESRVEAGVTDVGMIVGDTAQEIQDAVGDGSRWGAKVTYIRQSAPLGLAHAVRTAEDYLGDDDFVMYLGDNLILDGIRELVDEYRASPANAQILLTRVPEPERFGVAELGDDGKVTRLVEKPKEPRSDLALVGVYMFDKRIHEATHAIAPSPRGELEITDAIQWLIDHDYDVRPHLVRGWWKDTGRLDDMLEANRQVLENMEASNEGQVDGASRLEGMVVIQAGAVVARSTVRGPAIIGEGTRIIDSYVGPFTSIAAGCTVEDAEIEHSIVLQQSTVRGLRRIESSLIGRNVEVGRSEERPRAYRLMLGDHSQVGVI